MITRLNMKLLTYLTEHVDSNKEIEAPVKIKQTKLSQYMITMFQPLQSDLRYQFLNGLRLIYKDVQQPLLAQTLFNCKTFPKTIRQNKVHYSW